VSRTAGGRAKTPGGVPGENGSRCGSAGRCGAKHTLRAATAPGGGKSRKRTAAGGRPQTLGSAVGAVRLVQGAANDGVGAIVQRLERRYVSVPPYENHRCVGEVIGQLRWRSAGGGGVVSSGSMFGSTQCLRKLLKKNFRRKFWIV
jgi:hypothetical protein